MVCNIDTGIFIGVMSIFTAILVWIINRMDSDIKSLGSKIESDTRAHTQRTDQLYQMFIDLLKSQKEPKTDP